MWGVKFIHLKIYRTRCISLRGAPFHFYFWLSSCLHFSHSVSNVCVCVCIHMLRIISTAGPKAQTCERCCQCLPEPGTKGTVCASIIHFKESKIQCGPLFNSSLNFSQSQSTQRIKNKTLKLSPLANLLLKYRKLLLQLLVLWADLYIEF